MYLSECMEYFIFIKSFLTFLLIAFLLVMSIDLLGRMYPRHVNVVMSNSYFVPERTLYQFISDVNNEPKWRNSLWKIEWIDPQVPEWKEYFGKTDALVFRGNKKMDNLEFDCSSIGKGPFQFKRKYQVYSQDQLSFLKVEDSFSFPSPFLRFFASLFYDHSRYLKKELKNLDNLFS